ncbi:hypothetical protein PZA11_001220 [Diplocarpon coronariae]
MIRLITPRVTSLRQNREQASFLPRDLPSHQGKFTMGLKGSIERLNQNFQHNHYNYDYHDYQYVTRLLRRSLYEDAIAEFPTATTTVAPDGTTQTYCHPYNPTIDPPPEVSETRVDKNLPANAGTKTGISQPIPQLASQTTPNPRNNTRADDQPDWIANPQTQGRPNPMIQQIAPTPGTSNPNSFMQSSPRKPTPKPNREIQSQHAPPTEHPVFQTSSGVSSPRLEAELPAAPLSPINTGGRPIPPRSDFRTSPTDKQESIPTLVPEDPRSPIMPERSQRRPSRDDIVAPLNVSPVYQNKSYTEVPASVTRNQRGDFNGHDQGYYVAQPAGTRYGGSAASNRSPNEPLSPVSPITAAGSSGRPKTPNFSRPGVAVTEQSPSNAPVIDNKSAFSPANPALGTTTSVSDGTSPQQKTVGERKGFTATLKGLHGAGEALRGSVNEKIAHVAHDQAEEERMRAVREKGIGEWRNSGLDTRSKGLREGFREKAEGRINLRRASRDRDGVHGSEGPNGLEAVKETDR